MSLLAPRLFRGIGIPAFQSFEAVVQQGDFLREPPVPFALTGEHDAERKHEREHEDEGDEKERGKILKPHPGREVDDEVRKEPDDNAYDRSTEPKQRIPFAE